MEKLTIRRAEARDFSRLTELWDECFPDDIDFRRFFFKALYNPRFASVCEMDGSVCAMLHAFPFAFKTPLGEMRAKYIYGVGTSLKCRGLGVASKLLKSVENDCDFLVLIPQNKGLFKFYEKNGYNTEFYMQRITASPEGSEALSPASAADIPLLNDLYEQFTEGTIHPVRTREHWAATLEELSAAGGGISLFGEGYFAYYRDGKSIIISEIFPKTMSAARLSAGALSSSCTVLFPGDGEPFGVARLLTQRARDAFNLNAEKYLNLMHN